MENLFGLIINKKNLTMGNVIKLRYAVIPSQCAHWHGNPLSYGWEYGLPHQLSGLVGNDILT